MIVPQVTLEKNSILIIINTAPCNLYMDRRSYLFVSLSFIIHNIDNIDLFTIINLSDNLRTPNISEGNQYSSHRIPLWHSLFTYVYMKYEI